MTHLKTEPWNVVDHLVTKEDIAAYLEAALEDGDPALVLAAISDIARSPGVASITRESNLGSGSLAQPLASQGSPELMALLKVLQELGLRLRVVAT